MRNSKLYTLLILFAGSVAFAGPYRFTQDTLGVSWGMGTVKFTMAINKESFDLKMALMKTQMETIPSVAGRRELLRAILAEIQEARAQKPMLDDDVEVYMDLIVHSLTALPKAEKFDKKYCRFYQTQMLANYEPTALDENGEVGYPVDPAIIESLSVIHKICE